MGRRFEPLRPDEPIGVVALSGPVDPTRLEAGLGVLRSWGHELVLAPNLAQRREYLAGNDEQRLAGLDWVLDHGARFVIGARGGFGVTRLLHSLPWDRLVEAGTTFVGFSDVSALLNALAVRGGAAQVHGPMVAAGLTNRGNADRLRSLLAGRLLGEPLFRIPPAGVVRAGHARGRALGGNLALLTSLLGTGHEPSFDGSVVFLEEVGEPVYRLDRMLTHLASSGTFQRVKALIGGSLRGCRPAGECAERWRERIAELAPPGAVVAVGLPFGHGARNLGFPIGSRVDVDTESGLITWSG